MVTPESIESQVELKRTPIRPTMDNKESLNPRMNTLTTINMDIILSILTIRMPHNTMKDNPIVPRNTNVYGKVIRVDNNITQSMLLNDNINEPP